MDFNILHPQPAIHVAKTVKITPRGNMFKMSIAHTDANGSPVRNYEVWATKEAVQKHFNTQDTSKDPQKFELQKFARQMYEDRLRKTNGEVKETGMLATTTGNIHGNTKLWPNTLFHPEIKY